MDLMRRSRFRSLLCVYLAGTIAAGGCRTPQPADPATPKVIKSAAAVAAATTLTGRPQIQIEDAAAGKLTMRTANPLVGIANVEITALTDADTAALHARMEPLPDVSAFNAHAPIVRPPTAAPQIGTPATPIAFVVPTGKAVSDAPFAPDKVLAPLQAPQITPIGEVRVESEIRVRFSEPMVPVAAVGTVATPTIEIKPAVGGSWRWIDTRVVQFTVAPRFPQATNFEVIVKPGVEAISGARLATETIQKFSTPPIRFAGTYPQDGLRPDAPIAVHFDQDADPALLIPKLRVATKGGRALAFKAIELAAAKQLWVRDPSKVWDEKAAAVVANRQVILAPQGSWPAGTELVISLEKNAPSKAGPRLTTEVDRIHVDVIPPFTVLGIVCQELTSGTDDDEQRSKPRMAGARCPADNGLAVTFATPIQVSSYRAEKVQIVGLPFGDNTPSGDGVYLRTPKVVGRGYQIAVGDGLVDLHAQPLVGARSLSFITGPERFDAELDAPSGLHILDPRFEIPQWTVRTQAVASLRVQLYQVTPKDYFAFTAFERNPKLAVPGKKIFDQTHPVGGKYSGNLRADLRPALTGGFGHVIAVATAMPATGNRKVDPIAAWIQVTRLGASARLDGETINAWVHDITPRASFLTPKANVDVALLIEGRPGETHATSDATGHLSFELPVAAPRNPDQDPPDALLRLTDGTDTAFAAIDRFERTQRTNDALWYVTDDRFTYKPGESVSVKGWVRWTHNGPNPTVALPKPGETIAYALHDSRGTKIASGSLPLTDQGGFDVQVALPKTVNLGQASFWFSTRNDSTRHPIAIQEFRTPAYSVALDDDVSHRGSIPLILGESIEMSTTAKYYAGGGLGGASVDWRATLTTTRFEPPGWGRYGFDPPTQRDQRRSYRYREDRTTVATQVGSLSGASTAAMTWGLAALPQHRPSLLEVDATVTDVDRMSIRASSRPILVHPAAYYVGLRTKPEQPDVVQAIVTDIDGNAVEDVAVAIELEGVLGSERSRRDAKIVDTQSCKLASRTVAVDCGFRRDLTLAYTATATIADARGRNNVSQLEVPYWSRDDKQELTLVPDKQLYQPGDTAKIEIKSLMVPAHAIVTFARQGVIAQQRIELDQASTIVELPITVGHLKNIHVQVDRYAKRRHQQGDQPLPEEVSAELNLQVDLERARLDIRAKPSAKLVQPGDEATFEVDVRHDDKPVENAEVALLVVDEAILALSAGLHADPLLPFYRDVGSNTSAWNTLGMVHDSGPFLADKPGFERALLPSGDAALSYFGRGTIGSGSYGTTGFGSGGGGVGSGSAVVTARKDFRPTAAFSPTLRTDKHGHVSITVKMPDSLTRFRIVALATAKTNYFGKGENTIITQRKVNARTIAPRFLTQGDQFALPVVVQNLDTKPRTVEVAVRAANLVSKGPAGKRVTIPAGQRAEVRFDFATQHRGKAVIQTIMTSGAFADASNVELPIFEPATTEAFATYGVVDDRPQREQLVIPKDVFPEVGGVEVEVASTQMQSLTDAYWYLQAYPYECAEQRSGRMIATATMYDILDAFATPGRPTRSELDQQRTKDTVAFGKTQGADGGWGYFGGMKSDPMVSMQVLSALALSKGTGAVVQRATAFVTKESASLFARLAKRVALPARRADPADPYHVSLAAQALTTLALTGEDVRTRAEQLHGYATALGSYPIDAKARVLAILAKLERAKPIRARLVNDLLNATHETAGAATVTAQFVESERLLLVSSAKSNALVLDAMMREAPDQAIIQKLARGVLEGRKHGRWMSTQDNLVSLQAMRRFFDTYEKATPDYTGKLWLGTASYAEQRFVGHSNTRAVAQASWTTLAPGSTHDLGFVRDGTAGRLYYRVGIIYAPRRVDLPALDAGFVVRRSYTAADDPSEVIKNADGSYKIKLGAKVLITIETTNTTTRHAVALVDPLPAGFEIVNTALATAERAISVGAASSWWDHTNLRDNRAEAFRMQLPAGNHRYTYTVRATTPGVFIAAPSKAEEMYAPETFGRSNGMSVVIE